MKKILIFLFPIVLTSCFWPSADEVQKAKDEIFHATWSTSQTDRDIKNESSSIEEKSYYAIHYITKEKWLDIEAISNIEKIKDKLDIKWRVINKKIDTIKVIFENKTSTFQVDTYHLKTYKKWSETFLYRAYTLYDVLDFWLNEYTFEWYIWEELFSSVKLDIFIADPNKIVPIQTEEKIVSTSPKINTLSWDIFENLPTNDITYGEPKVNNDEQSFTYSNLKDFIATTNNELSLVNCENFWDYLKENYTWFYWNTCRPIKDENNFSVNVLSLTWDEYKYEKHYISAPLWIYGKVLLESGNGLMQWNLQSKNDELKTKTFDTTSNADILFTDLLQ